MDSYPTRLIVVLVILLVAMTGTLIWAVRSQMDDKQARQQALNELPTYLKAINLLMADNRFRLTEPETVKKNARYAIFEYIGHNCPTFQLTWSHHLIFQHGGAPAWRIIYQTGKEYPFSLMEAVDEALAPMI
jgi:cell division protein FtsB